MQQAPPKFEPPLPQRKQQALGRLGNGLLNKIVLLYPSSWWDKTTRTADGDPADWISILDDHSSLSEKGLVEPVQTADEARENLKRSALFIQNQEPITGLSCLLCFVGPPLAYDLELIQDDGEIGQIVHNRLIAAIWPADELSSSPPPKPSVCHVTRWASDPHSLGSYSYFPIASKGGGGPADMMEASHPIWSESLGFCGEHTEPNHFASVHGPLITGLREGRRVESLFREREERGHDDIDGSNEGWRGLRP